MAFLRKLLTGKSPPSEAPPAKRRKLVAKRRKAQRGAIRIDANAPILEQMRQWR